MNNKKRLFNDSNEDILVNITVYRVWQGTTYEQEIIWPKKTKLKKVLQEFQKNYLGDKNAYRILDYQIVTKVNNKE